MSVVLYLLALDVTQAVMRWLVDTDHSFDHYSPGDSQ
jgi:hypothetical protein